PRLVAGFVRKGTGDSVGGDRRRSNLSVVLPDPGRVRPTGREYGVGVGPVFRAAKGTQGTLSDPSPSSGNRRRRLADSAESQRLAAGTIRRGLCGCRHGQGQLPDLAYL